MSPPTTVVPKFRPEALPVPQGAGLTHRGRVRSANEDAILADPSGALWAVADGMGGHEGGAIAADIVVDSLAAIRDGDQPAEALEDAIEAANVRVRAAARQRGARTMGATVVALYIVQALRMWPGRATAGPIWCAGGGCGW